MITSSVEAESVASFFGRIKGTSAPYFFDIFAISLFSVETITELKIFESSAFSIVCAISGLPANFLIFFFLQALFLLVTLKLHLHVLLLQLCHNQKIHFLHRSKF